jgi:coniferyl-aldehyde dehydrogenase
MHLQDLPVPVQSPEPSLRQRFERMREAQAATPFPGRAERDRRLATLGRLVGEHAGELAAAVCADFGHRSTHETRLLEIFPSLEAVRHARAHLARWMAPERRATSMWFLPGRSRVIRQPLGTVGVIAPWNYPLYLAVGPLACALAAGNRAMVKMSEFVPRTGELFAALVARRFDPAELTVVLGDATLARDFAALPFDHLLFTGSSAVGRKVMAAAAANLTPVTLELGGKSPAILGPGADLAYAARRIAVGKTLNAGQTCIAPDYAIVPADKVEAFAEALAAAVRALYPSLDATPDYTHIVDARHYARLVALIEDARAKGARIVPLAAHASPDPARRRLPPFALLDVRPDMAIMQEEIFGPLLPVVPCRDLDAAIAHVNRRPRPLALYYFDDDRRRIERVLHETVSGGVTVNDVILHIAQDSLPFGGVGESGMGQYHGREGFLAFSKSKGVFEQPRRNAAGLLTAPYGRRFERLLALLLRGRA